jgi:hypothetical protein
VIDFRYHIVSLISVFLALAVGIALGAGPLKDSIGDTLTGQVSVLRTEKDALRTSLDTSNTQLANTNAYVMASAPVLLTGALANRRVAIVALGQLPDKDEAALEAQLTAAGASISARVTLAPAWTDPNLLTFRQALVGNLATYLSPVPAADVGPDTDLAEALAQGLTRVNPSATDSLAEPASVLMDLLSSGSNPLITTAQPVTAPADAIVVVMPQPAASTASAPPKSSADKNVIAAQVAILRAAQERSEGAVLAQGPRVNGDLTSAIFADTGLMGALTTVSGTDTITGQVSVPLALNARIGGVNGHYGFGNDETAMPVRVTLPPVDRSAQMSTKQGASAGTSPTPGSGG